MRQGQGGWSQGRGLVFGSFEENRGVRMRSDEGRTEE